MAGIKKSAIRASTIAFSMPVDKGGPKDGLAPSFSPLSAGLISVYPISPVRVHKLNFRRLDFRLDIYP